MAGSAIKICQIRAKIARAEPVIMYYSYNNSAKLMGPCQPKLFKMVGRETCQGSIMKMIGIATFDLHYIVHLQASKKNIFSLAKSG